MLIVHIYWQVCMLFLNLLQFNLGREGPCDEGGVIDDVRLPPWAQSAHDFIRIHREVWASVLYDCWVD